MIRGVDEYPFIAKTDSVVETLLNDVRFAGRILRKSPVFTAIAAPRPLVRTLKHETSADEHARSASAPR